ncbi:MAG TPA: hypothetical protein VGP58_01020 [Pyrinomonadaceae bacterium]|nr:hypothetical protein [Pyrinomonadaceae bacterium]
MIDNLFYSTDTKSERKIQLFGCRPSSDKVIYVKTRVITKSVFYEASRRNKNYIIALYPTPHLASVIP